jgi:hypothetical protein
MIELLWWRQVGRLDEDVGELGEEKLQQVSGEVNRLPDLVVKSPECHGHVLKISYDGSECTQPAAVEPHFVSL